MTYYKQGSIHLIYNTILQVFQNLKRKKGLVTVKNKRRQRENKKRLWSFIKGNVELGEIKKAEKDWSGKRKVDKIKKEAKKLMKIRGERKKSER